MLHPSLNQVLLASWRQRNPDAPWGRALLYGLLALSLAVGLWFMPDLRARIILSCAVLSGVVFGIWIALVANLLEQNHPNTAHCVPGHLRRLREAGLLAWGVSTLLIGLLLWQSVGQAESLPFMLLISAASCVYVAWAQRHWMLWFLVCFAPALMGVLRPDQRWAPLWRSLGETWRDQPWSVLALCLLALGIALTRVFGSGGDAHRAAYVQRKSVRNAMLADATGTRASMAMFGRTGELLSRPFDLIAAAWLAHVLAGARPSPRSAMARAEIVLHGQQHWLRHALGVGLACVFAGLGFAAGYALAGPQMDMVWKSGGIGMAMGLASAGFNPGFTLPNMLWHSRREQALLTLLPGMPQGAAQSRAVVWRQWRHFLGAWLPTTLIMVALAQAADQPHMLCLAFAALPVGVLALGRMPAYLRAPQAWTAGVPVLAFFLLGGLLWSASAMLQWPIWPVALVSLAASAALMAWRWNVISSAPQAMPAGRLA